MGVVIAKDSELGRELARWDTPRNQPIKDSNGDPVRDQAGCLIMGFGAIGYEEYPKMLYMAKNHPVSGKPSVGEVPPSPMECRDAADFERRSLFAEQWTRSCQKTVHDEQQERIAKGQGWCLTSDAALERFEQQQQEFARIAAEEAFKAKRMSEKAQAELAAADAATSDHVLDVTKGRDKAKMRPVTANGE